LAVKKGLFREQAIKLLCGMSASFSASFLTILSIDIEKALKNYPYNRALREIYIDSGRIAQKLLIKPSFLSKKYNFDLVRKSSILFGYETSISEHRQSWPCCRYV